MSDTGTPESLQRGQLPSLRLFLAAGAVELRVVAIVGNLLTIGRRPYNDVQLDDLTVSGEHALVRVRNGEVVVHDLGSRNGTLVNGLPIQQRSLVDGDVVDIGIYRLRFESARNGLTGLGTTGEEPGSRSDVADAGAPAETGGLPGSLEGPPDAAGASTSATGVPSGATGISSSVTGIPSSATGGSRGAVKSAAGAADARGGSSGMFVPSRPDQAFSAEDRESARLAHVMYLSGSQSGQTQPIDRAITRVGGLAGQVAVISRRKGGFFITHLEGLTFPQVNGEPIGLTACRLADGDLIELAGTMLRFRLGA